MKRSRATIAAGVLFCGVLIGVRGDALAGHPFGTEDAGTQGKGNVEVEFNLERQHGNDGTKTTSLGNGITMGIAPKIDLAVGYSYDFTKAEDGTKSRGMGPVEATLKTTVIEGKDRFPTLGVKAGFSLPTLRGGADRAAGDRHRPMVVRTAHGLRQRGRRYRDAPGGERRKNHLDPVKRGRKLGDPKGVVPPLRVAVGETDLPFRSVHRRGIDRCEEGDLRNVERRRRCPVGAYRRFAARDVPARIHARFPWRTFRPGRDSAGRRSVTITPIS